MIHCDREVKARKPDSVLVNKNEGSGAIIVPKTEQVRKNVKALESTGF